MKKDWIWLEVYFPQDVLRNMESRAMCVKVPRVETIVNFMLMRWETKHGETD